MKCRWIVAIVGAACGPAVDPVPTEPAEPLEADVDENASPADRVDGHARMIALLADEARRSDETNPYTGELQARAFRALVADPHFSASPMRRWRNLRSLAYHELRLGNDEAAIDSARAAWDLAAELGPQLRPADVDRTELELALAYLRWGERQNCVALHTSDSCILPIGERGVHTDQEGSRKGIAVLESLLRRTPDHLPARWLLNIAAMTVGEYPAGVPEAQRIPPEVFGSPPAFGRFVDVAAPRGVNTMGLGGGVAIADFDGDDRLDIVVSSSDAATHLRFLRGTLDGAFVDGSEAARLRGLTGGNNLVQADYDGDGDVDLLVLRGAWLDRLGRIPNSLLRNDGRGTFRDVTFEAGLGDAHYPSQSAAWADYDLDGDLDLFVGNEGGNNHDHPSQLFRNRGDGTFEDVAAQAGVENHRCAKGVAWGDFDADGDPDLYVSNYNDANRLYRNGGDGTFEDIAERVGVTAPWSSQAVVTGDFDGDGRLDLYVGAATPRHGAEVYSNRTDELAALRAVVASELGAEVDDDAEPSRLYRSLPGGRFEDITIEAGLDAILLTGGVGAGDLDADGHLDLYVGTSYSGFEGLMPNVLYHNRGGDGFVDVTSAAGLGHLQKAASIAIADLDGDGDQDIFVNAGGMFRGDRFGDVLFDNPGAGNHWIALDLRGVVSNRSGIGAHVVVEVREAGAARTIHHFVGSGSSLGSSPLRPWIGIGRAERIDRVDIAWPSGRAQTIVDAPVDTTITVTEPTERALAASLPD